MGDLARSMLACLLKSPRHLSVDEVPVPRLSRGEVLLRMKASGICGTDLEKVQGALGPGGILGHEVSGVVEEVGEAVEAIHQGDRVVAHHHVPCYHCYYCSHGDFTMCEEFKTSNFEPCGMADLFRIPESNVTRGALIPLPPALSFEDGAMVEPSACCIRAIRRVGVQPSDHVLVAGLGPTGLTQVQLLRRMTTGTIIGTDILESRLEMGKRMGANEAINPVSTDVHVAVKSLTGLGVDVAIVATGNEKVLTQALEAVRKGGRILLFGAPAQGARFNIDLSNLFSRQVSIVTSYSCVEAEMHQALRMLHDGSLDLRSLITDRFKLKDAPLAFEAAESSKTAIKTMIVA